MAIIEGGKETFFPNETWDSILDDLRKNKITFSEITVDNKPAIKVAASGGVFPLATPAMEEKSYGVVIKSGEEHWISVFVYKYKTIDEKPYQIEPSSDDISLFNQILSTFKFLD